MAKPVVAVPSVSTAQFKDAWPEILEVVNKTNKAAWMLAFALKVVSFEDSVLTLQFTSERDLESFKNSSNAPDILRKAIDQLLGVTVKFKPLISDAKTEPIAVVAADVAVGDDIEEVVEQIAPAPVVEKKSAKSRNSKLVDENERYGESLLREMLGAEPVDEKKNR